MQDSISEIARYFGVDELTTDGSELPARWNVAPTQPVLAVASSKDGATRRLGSLRWGLVPAGAGSLKGAARMINARAETVATKWPFSRLVARHRVIIPADGYYEWKHLDDGGLRTASKQPYYLHPADGLPLAFAGLWDVWRDAEGQPLRTCTIITTAANATTVPIHDRMPVILDSSAWIRWLAPDPLPATELARLLIAAPDDLLTVHPVGDRVNSARNDGPDLLDPVT
jgi:putative SOS response-associated peptidase YedK